MKKTDKIIDAICYRIFNSVITPDLIIINSKVLKKLKKRFESSEKGICYFMGVKTIGSKDVEPNEIIIK